MGTELDSRGLKDQQRGYYIKSQAGIIISKAGMHAAGLVGT